MKNKIKAIEDQGENQIKSLEKHGKQLVESNARVKKIVMILKISCFWRRKKYTIKLLLKGKMK